MYPPRTRSSLPPRALAVGDVVSIYIFSLAGAAHHGNPDPLHAAAISVPFVVGWLVVAYPAGVYAAVSARTEAFLVVGAWTVASVVGLGIRSTDAFHGGADPAFGFVTVVTGAALLVGWRVVVARPLTRLTRR